MDWTICFRDFKCPATPRGILKNKNQALTPDSTPF